MIRKLASDDRMDLEFDSMESPMLQILMRTAAEELDGVNELIEIQARRSGGRPYLVLPRYPETIH